MGKRKAPTAQTSRNKSMKKTSKTASPSIAKSIPKTVRPKGKQA